MKQIKYLISASLILAVSFALIKCILLLSSEILIQSTSHTEQVLINDEDYNLVSGSTLGKSLFQQNCQTCHSLDKNLTGPALRGFTERGPWSKKENIYAWIKNPAAFMTKDIYTQSLVKEYNILMQAFPNLSNEEIDSIIVYINESFNYSSMPVAIK